MTIGAAADAVRERREDRSAYAELPRPLRWALGFPRSPLWLGVAAAFAYLAVFVVPFDPTVLRAGGAADVPFWLSHEAAVEVVYALYVAWVPVAFVYLARGAARDALDLAPVLGVDEGGEDALGRRVLCVGARPLWIGAGIGLLFTVAAAVSWFTLFDRPPRGALAIGRVGIRELLVELGGFLVIAWSLAVALRLSRLARERARPDLLDLSRLAPLARNGARLAFFWLVIVAIGAPVAIIPPDALGGSAIRIYAIVEVVLALVSITALLIPSYGGHRAIRVAKAAELSRVRREIAAARRDREDARLPGLLAWEQRIASVSDWPIDARSLRRVGLYLLIPLASWVGGALVERLVDLALD